MTQDSSRRHCPEAASAQIETIARLPVPIAASSFTACDRIRAPGGAEGMPDRDAAAVRVEPFPWELAEAAVDPRLVAQEGFVLDRRHVAQNLRGEGLVDLPQIDRIEREAVAREQARIA
jgi:hypothetical protein